MLMERWEYGQKNDCKWKGRYASQFWAFRIRSSRYSAPASEVSAKSYGADFLKKYRIEGPSTVNEKEYEIHRLLGKGKGGYSYLTSDGMQRYVLKQIHHEPCDYYRFGNKIEAEIADYHRLSRIGIRIPKLLDVDLKQERIIKEYIEGDTIYDLVLRDRMQPEYLEQIHEMCVKLYAKNTNIDCFESTYCKNSGVFDQYFTPQFSKFHSSI